MELKLCHDNKADKILESLIKILQENEVIENYPDPSIESVEYFNNILSLSLVSRICENRISDNEYYIVYGKLNDLLFPLILPEETELASLLDSNRNVRRKISNPLEITNSPYGRHCEERPELCPIRTKIKKNIMQSELAIKKDIQDIDLPQSPESGCCPNIEKWLYDKVSEDSNYILAYGGAGIPIETGCTEKFDIYDDEGYELLDILQPPSNWHSSGGLDIVDDLYPATHTSSNMSKLQSTSEGFLNAMIGILLSSNFENLSIAGVNCKIEDPVESSELDLIMRDETKKNLLLVETSIEKTINKFSKKQKVDRQIRELCSNQGYDSMMIYLTTGSKKRYFGRNHGNVYLQGSSNKVPKIVSVADEYDNELIMRPKKYDSQDLNDMKKSIYSYTEDIIDELIDVTSEFINTQ